MPLTFNSIRPVGGMADLRRRHHQADRRGIVEALAHVPGLAFLLGGVLQIAAGHIQPGGIAPDMRQRVGLGDVRAALADRDDQFHLVVQLRALRRIGHVGVVQQQGVGGLHEEERRLPVRIAAHLPGVFGVVAADTKDTPDRESAAARDGNGVIDRGGR